MIYYYIDDLLAFYETHTRVSGIQRVTVAILEEFTALASAADISSDVMVLAYDHARKTLVSTSTDFFNIRSRSVDEFRAYFGLENRMSGTGKVKKKRSRLRRLWNRLLCKKAVGRYHSGNLPWNVAQFSDSDVVYVSGATWNSSHCLDVLSQLRRKHGVKIVQMVFDILPVSRPNFFEARLAQKFSIWIGRVNAVADMVLTGSQATRGELIRFAQDARLPPFRDLIVIPLAHEFLNDRRSDHHFARENILRAMQFPYALTVGTVEVRKNHLAMAQVWQRLSNTYGDATPRLVIAGRRGWLSDAFYNLMDRTDHLNGSVVIIEDASDEELAELYRNCLFSLYPSFAEGWGLPIGESIWFGKPVVTSAISSMPEVAGDFADYVDPESLDDLLIAVERLLEPAYRNKRAEALATMPLRTWSRVAEDIWTALTALASDRHPEAAARTSAKKIEIGDP